MVSGMLAIQGSYYIFSSHTGFNSWVLAALVMACATFLLLGLFTPIVSLLATMGVVGIAMSRFAAPAKNLFAEDLMAINVAVVLFSLLLLGPGAFSLDARLFGRREIIIPHTSSSIQL